MCSIANVELPTNVRERELFNAMKIDEVLKLLYISQGWLTNLKVCGEMAKLCSCRDSLAMA